MPNFATAIQVDQIQRLSYRFSQKYLYQIEGNPLNYKQMIDCTDCEESHEDGFDCSKILCVLCHDIHSFRELKEGICPKFYNLALKQKRKQSFPCLFCKDEQPEKRQKQQENSPCIYCDDLRFIDRFIYCCLKGCEECDWQGLQQNPQWVPLKKKYKRKLKANEEECNCPICHENIGRKEMVYRLECEHIFHKECSIRWLKINKICPVCRKEDYHFPFDDEKIKPNFDSNQPDEEEDSLFVVEPRIDVIVPPVDRILRSSRRKRERSESPVFNINTRNEESKYVSPLSRMNNPLWNGAVTRNRTRSPDVVRPIHHVNCDTQVRPRAIRQKPSQGPSAQAHSRSRSRSAERKTRPRHERSKQQLNSHSEDAYTGRQRQLLAIRRARYFEQNMQIAFGHLDESKIKQLAVDPNPAVRSEQTGPSQLRWRNYAIRGKNLHRVPVSPPIKLQATARKSTRIITLNPNANVQEVSSSSSQDSKTEQYNPHSRR